MNYYPLSYWMQKKNTAYYKNKKTTIYDDFLTYAQSKDGILAKANAIDFYNRATNDSKLSAGDYTFDVLEFGVGNGAFALSFLKTLNSLDKKNSTTLCSRLTYTFADFSKPVLMRATKLNSKYNHNAKFKTVLIDASSSNKIFSQKLHSYDLIRCNELFSDVSANLYCNKSGDLFNVFLSTNMKPKLSKVNSSDLGVLETQIMNLLPHELFIPLNTKSADSILHLCSKLKTNGVIDIFDYGFYFKKDFDIPLQMWNDSIVRKYASQWTVDLNFIYLCTYLLYLNPNLKTNVQLQKNYVQSVFAKKFILADTNSCLDYVQSDLKKENNFELDEDDSFYHLRVHNKSKQ